MSRCFAYSQPGYQRIGGPLAAAKSFKNEPKQEKGRKEKKEMINEVDKSQKHRRDLKKVEQVHKKRKYENGGELCEKKISPEAAGKFVMEQLEKSDLSEEHGLPSSILEPCESWESTQCSKRRSVLKQQANFAPTRSHGSIILRIKLPLQKHKSPVPDTCCKVPVLECKDPQHKEQNVPECSANEEEPGFSGCSSQEEWLWGKGDGLSGTRKSKRRSKSEEMRRQIRDLISDWKPAELHGLESDQGWLFERRRYKDPCVRDCGLESIVEDISSKKGSVAYQPRVCFMPEFNTYQMPYVFPF